MATHGEIRWPSVGLSMAAYGEIPMAIVTPASSLAAASLGSEPA
jgi:hypothetical protein